MTVDAKRIQAVFQVAVEAANPVRRAAILDRECASDPEMRQRVEMLLKVYGATAGNPDQTIAIPFGVALPLVNSTMARDPSIDPEVSSVTNSRHDPVTEEDESNEDQEETALEFLQPSSKPGSFGRLGHHEVLEVLGKGGFGTVVRAFDESLHRMVAIKVLSPQLASTSPARRRFLREACASARVRHGSVVQIYAVEEQPLPYLVMEYIPGQTLQQRLDQIGPLEVSDILRIGGQIARGLAAAHQQGVIHRDIKPANILLESGVEQNVKITDFGLARAADDVSLSQSGVISGTPSYMAPEQATGEQTDHRCDLFSLGSVLYAMASGRPPFRGATPLAVLQRVAEDAPRPIRQIIPEVPQWLCDVIARLHAKDPAHRFQTAAEVAALLEQHLAHLQQPSRFARPEPVKIPHRRKPLWFAVLASTTVGLVILGTMIAYLLWRPAAPNSVTPGPDTADNGAGLAQLPVVAPAQVPASEPPRTYVLQGRSFVRDALIDFAEPNRSFGAAARDNAIRLAERCTAFLVRFDLAKLKLPQKARVVKATLSFYVWDPSSMGKTKVCAFPMKTPWDEVTATWQEPAVGKSWRGGASFALGADAGSAGPAVVVGPEHGTDTLDPPMEYQLDVTEIVQSWLDGRVPNHGMSISPVIDPDVNEGTFTRFQVYGSEYSREEYTPSLTLLVNQ